MCRELFAIALCIVASGCEKPVYKVLLGAHAVTAPGARPLEDAVIVIAGKNIRAVGVRRDVPIPQNSDRTDLAGRWVIPADGFQIAVNEPANLIILDHAPPATSADRAVRIVNGEWQKAP